MKNFLLSKNRMLLPLVILMFVLACSKHRDDSAVIEEVINVSGFNKVYAGERFNVVITKGAAFSVTAKGPEHDVHDVEFAVANGLLEIQYQHYESNRPKVDISITMPTLVSVNLAGAGTGIISGFQDEPHVVRAVLSGASTLTMNGTGINTQVDISGGSELTVTGATLSLYGYISGAGRLFAYGVEATEVDITAAGGSVAKVKALEKLFVSASGGSKIYYKGSPNTKNVETSGGGEVIHE
jgi:hypothetical protein